MSLRKDIQRVMREHPEFSGTQIADELGKKPNRTFWRILNEEQVSRRGLYPGRRHNTTAHNKARHKEGVRFIPPKRDEP
jgi:hypothetical protein